MFATDEKHFLLTILGPHLMPKTEIGLRTGHLQKVGCLLGLDVQELGGNKTIPIEVSCGGRYDPVWGEECGSIWNTKLEKLPNAHSLVHCSMGAWKIRIWKEMQRIEAWV